MFDYQIFIKYSVRLAKFSKRRNQSVQYAFVSIRPPVEAACRDAGPASRRGQTRKGTHFFSDSRKPVGKKTTACRKSCPQARAADTSGRTAGGGENGRRPRLPRTFRMCAVGGGRAARNVCRNGRRSLRRNTPDPPARHGSGRGTRSRPPRSR